jgi:hypothetical protein
MDKSNKRGCENCSQYNAYGICNDKDAGGKKTHFYWALAIDSITFQIALLSAFFFT